MTDAEWQNAPDGAPTSLPDGTYTVEVGQSDAAGNSSSVSKTVKIDATAPVLTLTGGVGAASSDATPDFAGSAGTAEGSTLASTADAGDLSIWVYAGGSAAGAPVRSFSANRDPATGAWSVPADWGSTPALDDGTYTVRATQTDDAGNLGTAEAGFTIDTSAPSTTITLGPAPTSRESSGAFAFTSTETEVTFECQLDPGPGANWEPCSSPSPHTALSDGAHEFRVRAIDRAGNHDSTPETRQWIVDTQAPQTVIDAGPTGSSNQTSSVLNFSASEESSFRCRLDAGDLEACVSPLPLNGLSDGLHTFTVAATDTAGNADESPAELSWSVDTEPPSVDVASGPDGPDASSNASFSFTSDDPEATLECQLDGDDFTGPCFSPKLFRPCRRRSQL